MGTAWINFVYRKQCFSCQAKHIYRCWAIEPECWQVNKTVPASWDCLLFYKLIIAWNTQAFKVLTRKYVLNGWKHYFVPLCVDPNGKVKEKIGIVFCPEFTALMRSLAISTGVFTGRDSSFQQRASSSGICGWRAVEEEREEEKNLFAQIVQLRIESVSSTGELIPVLLTSFYECSRIGNPRQSICNVYFVSELLIRILLFCKWSLRTALFWVN